MQEFVVVALPATAAVRPSHSVIISSSRWGALSRRYLGNPVAHTADSRRTELDDMHGGQSYARGHSGR